MHSSLSENLWEHPDPLSDMVSSAINSKLDWVIFTEHSNFLDESEWNQGYTSCVGNSTDSFKCLYAQEMAVEAEDFNDASHYLTYPYSDDHLGYINGRCNYILWNEGCRDAQQVINEVNNAGGMGFIAHPYDMTHFLNWEDWNVNGYSGLEIVNAVDGVLRLDDFFTMLKWDELLQEENNPNNGFVVGIGNSDAHHQEEVGYTFDYCYLDSLTTNNIRDSLKKGNCIASNGPFINFTINNAMIGEIADICTGDNVLHIYANSTPQYGELEAVYVYIDGENEGNNEELSDYSDIKDININLGSNDKYIRLVLETDNGHWAYTNPIWFNIIEDDDDGDGYCAAPAIDCEDNNENINIGENEICDGEFDENCNGIVDEGCDCEDDDTQSCGVTNQGRCELGTQTCINGEWNECEGNIDPTPEICNGEDDNCNGASDENNICQGEEGSLRECDNPESWNSSYEWCMQNNDQRCTVSVAVNYYTKVNDIKWGSIEHNDSNDPYVLGNYSIGWRGVDAEHMYYEVADPRIQNETFHDGSCYFGGPREGDHGCHAQDTLDIEGTKITLSQPGTASTENVVGFDWENDENAYYACTLWFNGFTPNYIFNGGEFNRSIYVLNCYDNSTDCGESNYCDKSGNWNEWNCQPMCSNGICEIGENCPDDGSGNEMCNNLDDDCNGYIDENLTQQCGTTDVGACEFGIESCSLGGWFSCNATEPVPEICNNLDDDCDGETDEGCDDDNDNYCDIMMIAIGTPNTCTANGIDCNDTLSSINPGSNETCNDNLDNNCNGIVDYEDDECASPPTNISIIYPSGGEIVNESVKILWNESSDPNNDIITYFIDLSNNSGENWNNLISSYGYENKFNDSSTEKELTFDGNQNQTVYLRIKKETKILFAIFDLLGVHL